MREWLHFYTVLIARFRKKRKWDRFWKSKGNASWELHKASHHIQFLFDAGWFKPNSILLDIGCGSGHNASWLAAHGLRVYGVDISRFAIRRASMRYRSQPQLILLRADATRPIHGIPQVDYIIDRGCLHGLAPQTWGHYVRNVERLLKKDGIFVLLAAKARGLEEYFNSNHPATLTIVSSQDIEMLEESPSSSVPGVLILFRRTEE